MGVKYSVTLTRRQAEDRATDITRKRMDRGIRPIWLSLTDSELEWILEVMNDREHDGEGFENYCIVD